MTLFITRLNVNDSPRFRNEIMLDAMVQWRVTRERRSVVDFHEDRFATVVYKDIEAKHLEACIAVIAVRKAAVVHMRHLRLGSENRFDN
eukprot:CAMPEP_0176475294 /NCGR_PEP_ID=MMETSP0127-20121128/43531_1 /TAXON_ID=938130 /ORGANISM="Platyophrya macrostoma, Strain WH" /LENGTH=88 /DNA_ID=CAMNT_0017870883 /DNA_START=141 /DNA_END=407 /DNA_ORIENTATION=-